MGHRLVIMYYKYTYTYFFVLHTLNRQLKKIWLDEKKKREQNDGSQWGPRRTGWASHIYWAFFFSLASNRRSGPTAPHLIWRRTRLISLIFLSCFQRRWRRWRWGLRVILTSWSHTKRDSRSSWGTSRRRAGWVAWGSAPHRTSYCEEEVTEGEGERGEGSSRGQRGGSRQEGSGSFLLL